MYKKVTHHITEEHFAHPQAADIKKAVESKKPIKPKSFYIVNDTECYGLDNFSKHNIYAWSGLAGRLHDIVVSVCSGSLDSADLITQLATDISKISKMISPIATDAQVTQFNTLLTTWSAAVLTTITDTVGGKDTTADMTALTASISALATFLNSIETTWDASTVTTILTNVSNLYIAQATARVNKDWAGSSAASNNAYKALVVEQDDGSPSLADIFASGIISD